MGSDAVTAVCLIISLFSASACGDNTSRPDREQAQPVKREYAKPNRTNKDGKLPHNAKGDGRHLYYPDRDTWLAE